MFLWYLLVCLVDDWLILVCNLLISKCISHFQLIACDLEATWVPVDFGSMSHATSGKGCRRCCKRHQKAPPHFKLQNIEENLAVVRGGISSMLVWILLFRCFQIWVKRILIFNLFCRQPPDWVHFSFLQRRFKIDPYRFYKLCEVTG